jgi:hypothetical protein
MRYSDDCERAVPSVGAAFLFISLTKILSLSQTYWICLSTKYKTGKNGLFYNKYYC